MNKQDKVKEMADLFGGWESFARGLYDYDWIAPGDRTKMDAAYNKEQERRYPEKKEQILRACNPAKRQGPKRKNNLEWFFRVEKILAEGKEKFPDTSDIEIIRKSLPEIKNGTPAEGDRKKRLRAADNINNRVLEHRKIMKEMNHSLGDNLSGVTLYPIEESEIADDPQLHQSPAK